MSIAVKPIRSAEDCAHALAEIDRLFGAEPGTEAADRLEILSILVADYERRHVRLPEPDPIAFLEFAMAGQGRTQSDLAQLIGSRSRASEVLKRKRPLSAEMIEKIVAAWRLPYDQLSRQYRVQSPVLRLMKRGAVATGVVLLAAGITLSAAFWSYGTLLPGVVDLKAYAETNPVTQRTTPAGPPQFVAMPDIPIHVVKAFLAAEDRSFFGHGGYDLLAILRASLFSIPDLLENKKPSGGATITQQLAKNMLLAGESPSVSRKIKEIILARRLEDALSKTRILELYLNTIYYGGPAYGIADAASFYFGKTIGQLSISESAYLAALPKAPNTMRIDVAENMERARLRRDWVLSRMADDGLITSAVARMAQGDPLQRSVAQ
jgi:penicillin-binding protein 1A